MYKALYRKYRSKTFDELYGQEAVVTSLKNQVKNNEISHAYIFSGTRGTGKTSAAKILSRAVNCLNPKDGNPCNECENCKRILNESVLDVVEMDAASNNGVDDIRELKEKVIYPPTALKYKVYIIDEVHMLSKGAFNALLKILEEPPRHLIFILATTEIEKIPATILSRSQKFNFKRIPLKDIEDNLKRITKLENKSCDEEVYTLIAKSSDGAMRDALSVLDQLITRDDAHISAKDAMEILGISSSDLLFELSESLIYKDINKSLEVINEIFKEGVDFVTLSSQILSHFRDLILVKTLKEPNKIVFSTYIKEFNQLAINSDVEDLLIIIDILKELSQEIKYANNKRVAFEMNCVKICTRNNRNDLIIRIKNIEDKLNNFSIKDLEIDTINRDNNNKEISNYNDTTKDLEISLDKEYKDLGSIEKYNESDIIENSINKNIEKCIDENLDLNKIKKDFPNIIKELSSKGNMGLAGFLKEGILTDYSFDNLEITFDEAFSFHYNYCNQDENKKNLSEILKLIYGRDITVKFKLEKSSDKLEEVFGKDNILDI